VLSKDGASVREIPHLEGDKLTLDVRVLDSDLAGADGPVLVFVDIIGLPFTPLSPAGAAHAAPPGMAQRRRHTTNRPCNSQNR
jgi:hypothetical protein